jgi:hypothetical protein
MADRGPAVPSRKWSAIRPLPLSLGVLAAASEHASHTPHVPLRIVSQARYTAQSRAPCAAELGQRLGRVIGRASVGEDVGVGAAEFRGHRLPPPDRRAVGSGVPDGKHRHPPFAIKLSTSLCASRRNRSLPVVIASCNFRTPSRLRNGTTSIENCACSGRTCHTSFFGCTSLHGRRKSSSYQVVVGRDDHR